MNYEVVDNPEKSRFEINVEGELAVADYRLEEGALELTHTEVPSTLRGRGLAKQLAHAALGTARENNLVVRPYCAFMSSFIEKNKEYQDLVQKP